MIWKLSVMHLCLFFISDIDMYNRNDAIELKVNGIPVQLTTQTYQHPTGNSPKTILTLTFTHFSLFESEKKNTFTFIATLSRPNSHSAER